jgi:hypothetical protein
LPTAQGLKGLDHRMPTPSLGLVCAFLVETFKTFGLFVDRADIFRKDALLGRGRTDSL